MLFRPAALRLSAQALTDAAGVIRRHREKIGSAWRKLSPGRRALPVLACLRTGDTSAELAAGFGIGTATAWRSIAETTALLAARAPNLRRALTGAKKAGHGYVVIGGTLIPLRPGRRRPALLPRQAPAPRHERAGHRRPGGGVRWVSGPLPGAVHDLTAARIWGISASWPPPG